VPSFSLPMRRMLAVAVATGFAVIVVTIAISFSGESLVNGSSPAPQTPDSIFILTKDPKTANQIVKIFQSTAADASKYSLSVGEPVASAEALKIPLPPEAKGFTSRTYYLVSTFGSAPLKSMVLLQNYAVSAGKRGLATVVGNDTDDSGTTSATGGSNTSDGGTSFTTGATNTNTGKLEDTLKGGIIGVASVTQVREALRSINPALYSATYFSSQEVVKKLPAKK
jgi:hypothetical protein